MSGGTDHVPSERKYLVAAPALGAGTRPAFPAADVLAPVIFEYVVFVGTTQVPSPRKKDVCFPAAGAGTSPVEPAAEDVAPFIVE